MKASFFDTWQRLEYIERGMAVRLDPCDALLLRKYIAMLAIHLDSDKSMNAALVSEQYVDMSIELGRVKDSPYK